MGRPLPAPEYAMEVQARLRSLRRETAPLYESAMRTGDQPFIAAVHDLANLLRVAEKVAKRVTGMAESACADGIAEPGHGAAA